MPPKTGLTKDQIAQKAYEILKNEGYDSLNARYLATQLGVSTMPLFKHYKNMDEIKAVAVELGVAEYCRYMEKGSKEPIPFKGIGRAYVSFAKNEPKLFEIFFMRPTDSIVGISSTDPNTKTALNIAADIMSGNSDDGHRLLKDMWLVVHGIATLEATGKASFTEEELSETLSEIFMALKNHMGDK